VTDALLRAAGRAPGALVAVAYAPGIGAAIATGAEVLTLDPVDTVLRQGGAGLADTDLRNPPYVRAALARIGIDLADTRPRGNRAGKILDRTRRR
jgi:hypothetical protein